MHRLSYPDMRAELVLNDRKVDLIEEQFDVAFHIGSLENDGLVAHALPPYRMILAAAPSYLERCGSPLAPVDLPGHNLIGFPQWGSEEFWTLTGPDGEHRVPLPTSRLRINHAAALREAAVAGFGIILQSSVTLEADLASGRLCPVLPLYAPEPRSLTLVHLPDRRTTAGLRAFVGLARASMSSIG
jgi:DNA-binding transcriptional LysR family regulator